MNPAPIMQSVSKRGTPPQNFGTPFGEGAFCEANRIQPTCRPVGVGADVRIRTYFSETYQNNYLHFKLIIVYSN